MKSNTHLDHLDPIAPAGKVLKCCKILKYTHLMQKGKEFYFKKQPRDNLRTEVCKRVQVHPSALLIAETEANSAP